MAWGIKLRQRRSICTTRISNRATEVEVKVKVRLTLHAVDNVTVEASRGDGRFHQETGS